MKKYSIDTVRSPLDGIDASFSNYVAEKKRTANIHMNGSVPDYSFSLDYELRTKLEQIPHFYTFCKQVTSTYETRQMQIINQSGIKVGPAQYPEIYQMGLECSSRLGIGIPNIYIVNQPVMNAYTICTDDTSPLVVLYTGIVDRMTPGELKVVIGHECGHIHNLHSVYQTVIDKLLTGASGFTGSILLSLANVSLMHFWTRSCEVTADRAAMICADNLQDVYSVNAKLASGGTLNKAYQKTYDIDAIYEQLSMTLDNPTRLLEITSDHPAFARRIFCEKEFSQCDIFYRWRQDLKKPGLAMHDKAEIDTRCKKLVSIVKNK